MSEDRTMLFDAACRLFEEGAGKESRLAAEHGEFPEALWARLADAGFLHPSVPEELGGVGGDALDEFAILRAAGRHAVPGPLADTMLAGWLAAACGVKVPEGPLAVAPVNFTDRLRLHKAAGNYKLEGEARRVAWASAARQVLLVAETGEGGSALVRLEPGGIRRAAEANMAGEPRETLAFRNFSLGASLVTKVEVADLRERLLQRGAAMRAALMAGALEGVLARAVTYAGERVQFGRAIGKFQAVQQELAKLAGQTAAALTAAEGAYGAISRG
ncbi:MAG: acyl-CoA/acyl-ACP dehydrogenase, partial [Alphaproteobacteria bacterium]|nr:acyl-CoA/acyl-ACP dehydrogenase [Alphaproteobacteria bacterium]